MNWDDLKLFLEVARRQTLDEAATNLRQDPTTISRRLRRLETQIGQTLFERTRRGHILSSAGERLVSHVEAMEASAAGIMGAGDAASDMSGHVRLGVPEGLGVSFIAPALSELATQYPQLHIDLITLSGFVSVPKREADMSILLTRPQTGRLKVLKLGDQSLCLYGHKSYLDDHPPVKMLQDLQDHTLIGYVEDRIYSSQLRYFDEVLTGLTPTLCSTNINVQHQLIQQGAGIGVLPRFIAHQSPDLEIVLKDEITITRSFWLAIHEDVANLARIKAMRDFLVRLFSTQAHVLKAP